jgi:hypothetical protein
MNKKFFLCLVVFSTLFYSCNFEPSTGTEVENERFTARIVNPDGTAAANATVTILPVTYIPKQDGIAKQQLTTIRISTDSNGYFDISELEEGCYTIYAEKEGMATYNDSVYITTDGIEASEFSLDTTSQLCGNIQLQPNHDPRLVEVQLLGTNFYTNADSVGSFCFSNIAHGEYRLRAVADKEGYIPVNMPVSTSSTVDTTMLYTGIPIVENLTAAIDTGKQQVILSWKKTSYRDFYEYVIYRDFDGTVQPSEEPIAVTADTFYIDSSFSNWANTEPPVYRYRVAIRTNGMELGPTYGFSLVSLPQINIQVTITTDTDSLYIPQNVDNEPPIRIYFHVISTVPITSIEGYSSTDDWNFLRDSISKTEDIFEIYDSIYHNVLSPSTPYFEIMLFVYAGEYMVVDSFYVPIIDTTDTTVEQSGYIDTMYLYADSADTLYDLSSDTLFIVLDTLHSMTTDPDTSNTQSFHQTFGDTIVYYTIVNGDTVMDYYIVDNDTLFLTNSSSGNGSLDDTLIASNDTLKENRFPGQTSIGSSTVSDTTVLRYIIVNGDTLVLDYIVDGDTLLSTQ